MIKKYFPDLIAIFLLAVFLLVFFFPVLFGGETFVTTGVVFSDLMNQNYPFKVAYSQALKAGQLPFWVSKMGNGFPLLAEGQVGAFYPLNLLFFYFLSPLLAFNVSLVFHYFLAGLFVYLLARSWLKLASWPALLAGLVFSLSGFMLIHLVHLSLLQTVVWLPLQLWLLEKIVKKPRLWQGLILGLVFAIQFLASHPELFYFSALFLGTYLLLKLFITQEKKSSKNKKLVWTGLFLATGVVVTVALSAGQLLESWQMVGVSDRASGFSFQETTSYLFPLRHFLTLVTPWVFDFVKESAPPVGRADMTNLWETYLYLGILPLLLATLAVAVKIRKDRRVQLLLVWLVFSLVLALGRSTPIFKLFWNWVPGMKLFKYPTRFLVFSSFNLALLSGVGATIILEKIKKVKVKKWLGLVLVGLVFIDLLLVQRGINPTMSAKEWFAEPETAIFLKENLGEYRFYTLGTSNIEYASIENLEVQKGLRELLPGDFNLIYDLRSANDQAAFFLDRHTQLTKGISEARLKFEQPGSFTVPEALIKTLSLRSVKYILSPLPLTSQGGSLREVRQVELPVATDFLIHQPRGGQIETTRVPVTKVYVYENQPVLPRARMIYQIEECPGCPKSELLKTLVAEDFEMKEEVLLEEKLENSLISNSRGEAVIIQDEDLKVVVKVKSSGDGLLVLADNHYPAWQAFLDGQPTKIYQANFAFRAVWVPAGEHTVEFKYLPFNQAYKLLKYIGVNDE